MYISRYAPSIFKYTLLRKPLPFFPGPSYKRGPPKGYIRAIEMRWHQVESLLGAIIQCRDSRVQSLVSDLRQDPLAREILNRVDMGPYVCLHLDILPLRDAHIHYYTGSHWPFKPTQLSYQRGFLRLCS